MLNRSILTVAVIALVTLAFSQAPQPPQTAHAVTSIPDPPPAGKQQIAEPNKYRLLFLYQRAVNTNNVMNAAMQENNRAIAEYNAAVQKELERFPKGTMLKPNKAGDDIEITLPAPQAKENPPPKEPAKK